MESHLICWLIVATFLTTSKSDSVTDTPDDEPKSSSHESPVVNKAIRVRRICPIDLSNGGGPGYLSDYCYCEITYPDGELEKSLDSSACRDKETQFIFNRKPFQRRGLLAWRKRCFLNWSKHRTQSGSIPDIVCFCFDSSGAARADGGINLFCSKDPLSVSRWVPRMNVYYAIIQHSVDDIWVKKCKVNLPEYAVNQVRHCFCETKDGRRLASYVCEKFKGKKEEISSYLYFRAGNKI